MERGRGANGGPGARLDELAVAVELAEQEEARGVLPLGALAEPLEGHRLGLNRAAPLGEAAREGRERGEVLEARGGVEELDGADVGAAGAAPRVGREGGVWGGFGTRQPRRRRGGEVWA